jgi:hypothetical protein
MYAVCSVVKSVFCARPNFRTKSQQKMEPFAIVFAVRTRAPTFWPDGDGGGKGNEGKK